VDERTMYAGAIAALYTEEATRQSVIELFMRSCQERGEGGVTSRIYHA